VNDLPQCGARWPSRHGSPLHCECALDQGHKGSHSQDGPHKWAIDKRRAYAAERLIEKLSKEHPELEPELAMLKFLRPDR